MRVPPLLLLVAALLLAACNSGPVRSIHSSDEAKARSDEEGRIWLASSQLDDALARKGVVYDDPRVQAYVQQLGERLYPDLKEALQFRLIDSPSLNAFALGNGSIYINTGMLARLDNEAQLATLLAHEVTHFTQQHVIKNRRVANSSSVAGLGITLLTGIPFSGQLIAAGSISGYSQDLEREADQLGFERVVAAGYHPRETVKTFQHLLQEVQALDIKEPYFFSSHPRLTERIASFNSLIEQHARPSGVLNAEVYLETTAHLRELMLARYAELHQYQTLILMLGAGDHQGRYPEHWPFYLGEAYRQRDQEGDPALAEQAYQDAIDAVPGFAPAYRALGLMKMKRSENHQALGHFRRYLQLDPDAPDRAYIEAYIKSIQ